MIAGCLMIVFVLVEVAVPFLSSTSLFVPIFLSMEGKMMKKFWKYYLDITDLEGRVDVLEKDIERQLRHFGNYEKRTKEELVFMKKQIGDILKSIDSMIKRREYKDDIPRAKNLLKKLKNNKTRIENALRKTA